MTIKLITTEQDYKDAIKRLEDIFDAAPNTVEGDELEVLGGLIDDFEKIHLSVDFPGPIE